jgi:hypothetical protein
MKYTAKEILEAAGVTDTDAVFGKFRCHIGGVVVNRPDHIINVPEAKTVSVLIGVETEEVTLPERSEPSDEVKAVIKAKGEKSTEAFKAAQIAKAESGAFGDASKAEYVLNKRLGKTETEKHIGSIREKVGKSKEDKG